MSLKKTQECASYMDTVKVKIAEEYKPPPKINILMTHSQRLKFNRQVEDNLPKYDFFMENDILQRVREWKNNRLTHEKQRKIRLVELNEKDKEEAGESETDEGSSPEALDVPSVSQNEIVMTNIGVNNIPSFPNGFLLPNKATNQDLNILQPIPSNSHCKEHQNKNIGAKSTFNLSEFEADTSSPFDSVALKSINDVEELAKVLKIEEAVPVPPATVNYANFQAKSSHQHMSQPYHTYTSISNFIPSPFNNQNSVAGMNSFQNSGIQCTNSYHSRVHGYQAEFISKHLFDERSSDVDMNGECTDSQLFNEKWKNVDDRNEQTKKCVSHDHISVKSELPNPYEELPKHLQDLSKTISSMGFPLQRVARTCKAIGDDNKKVVDHLLALSELLDLGFSEDKISEALLMFDNDRDKALDKLIS